MMAHICLFSHLPTHLQLSQSIINDLQAPVVDAVVRDVRTAHSDVLPGLPHPEIPVISLTGANTHIFSSLPQELICFDSTGFRTFAIQ
jgi:hypothetical protein